MEKKSWFIEKLHDGFLKVFQIGAMIKDQERTYELIDIRGAVAGLVVDGHGKIGLVYQYRPAAGKEIYELPAGTIDKEGFSKREILIDEIIEEMGIDTTNDVRLIAEEPVISYYMMVGCCNGTMDIYVVIVSPQEDRMVDDCDVIRTEWVDMATFKKYIDEGMIVDGKTIMAYWFLKANPGVIVHGR